MSGLYDTGSVTGGAMQDGVNNIMSSIMCMGNIEKHVLVNSGSLIATLLRYSEITIII
jgi:hypothetical protein